MANPNSMEHVDFQTWEAEMEPYGVDVLVESMEGSPTRALACSSVADFAILDIAPEDVKALQLS